MAHASASTDASEPSTPTTIFGRDPFGLECSLMDASFLFPTDLADPPSVTS
jgi:hypothetical protein